jgi:hypothetical protein
MAAARAIAHTLKWNLLGIDLAHVEEADAATLIQLILEQSPPLLFLKSAQVWLGRQAQVPRSALQQFLSQRQQFGLTLFSVNSKASVRMGWRHQMLTFEFPWPDVRDRLQLWQQALSEISVDPQLDWQQLAKDWTLNGGAIRAIAQASVSYATAENGGIVGMEQLQQAYRETIVPILKPNPRLRRS